MFNHKHKSCNLKCKQWPSSIHHLIILYFTGPKIDVHFKAFHTYVIVQSNSFSEKINIWNNKVAIFHIYYDVKTIKACKITQRNVVLQIVFFGELHFAISDEFLFAADRMSRGQHKLWRSTQGNPITKRNSIRVWRFYVSLMAWLRPVWA